jgi:AcrR family transcriptional regulator
VTTTHDRAPVPRARVDRHEARRAQTRERIVGAAMAVFSEHGYGASSVGQVSTRAGVNRATFYLHFTDKAALLREVVALERMGTHDLWRALGDALVAGTRDSVGGWVVLAMDWSARNAPLMSCKHEAMASDPEFAQEFQPRYDRLAEGISAYLDTLPAAEREDAKLRVQMLVVMLDQMFLHAVVQGQWTGPDEQLLRVATDLCCRALSI